MKKFLSLALALAMTVALVPATAFASSDAYVSNTVTVEEDTILTEGATGDEKEAPVLTLEAKSNFKRLNQNFRLKLENAEFTDAFFTSGVVSATVADGVTQEELDKVDAAQDAYDTAVSKFKALLSETGEAAAFNTVVAAVKDYTDDGDFSDDDTNKYLADRSSQAAIKAGIDAAKAVDTKKGELDSAKAAVDAKNVITADITKISDTQATIKLTSTKLLVKDDEVSIVLETKATGGVATVSVVALESEFTAETKTFAKTSDGATNAYVESTKNFQDGGKIDDFYIEEVVAGTIKAGTIKLKLSSGFEYTGTPKASVVEGTAELGAVTISDGDTIEIPVKSADAAKALLIKVEDIQIGEDGADFGKTAKISVSGADTSKQTVEVGTYADFGMTLKAAAKEVPVIYAGTAVGDGDNDENKTLKVTLEETVAGSWIEGRKLTLKLPEGVEFVDVDKVTATKFDKNNKAQDAVKDAIKADEDNEISFSGDDFKAESATSKRKLEIEFNVSAEVDFTGDVDLVVSGAAIANEELKATLATVKAPIEVKTEVNEVIIDYKNTPINDITLIEPAAGLWEKGDVIILDAEEMKFEGKIKAEVVKGDMKLEKLDGDNVEVAKKEGTIEVKVKSQSSGTPAEIKISGIELYLERSLPAGDYELTVKGLTEKDGTKKDVSCNKFFMNNFHEDGDDLKGFFETEDVTVMKDFVKVVTAGRDQNDTFTTKITVPVGKDTILAGTKEIKVDAAAYINKDGYTMLPVRAVTEALNGLAIVRWDDATKTATISFGSRVFSMTVASKTMNMNGVNTTLLAAPEIKNSRIFLPLRDLGYALGLTDSKITWDAATATATLN